MPEHSQSEKIKGFGFYLFFVKEFSHKIPTLCEPDE